MDALIRSALARMVKNINPSHLGPTFALRVWSKNHPSQFPDQSHRVNSHRHQPRVQLLKPPQAATAPGEHDQRPVLSPVEQTLRRQVFEIF